jgi:carboxylesterase
VPIVQKNAEQFFFQGGEIGCLLVHGFTGSPSEMRYLGDYLAKQGYTVKGVRLAGHGTTPEEMADTTWPDWYKSVETAYHELCEHCSKVFILGLSMGGILTLHASVQFPTSGIVVINAPIFLQDQTAFLTPVLKHVLSYTNKKDFQPIEDNFAYPKMPLKCVSSLLSLIRTVRRELPKVNSPLLLLQSDKDKTVIPRSADYIFSKVGAREKEIVRFPKSGHLLTIGVEREEVAKRIVEFLRKHR